MRFPFLAAALMCGLLPAAAWAEPVEVKIAKNEKGQFTLMRGGKPYAIRGAASAENFCFRVEER